MKLFVCECGKEYTNSQGFNGHRAHCKVHLATLGEDHVKQREQLDMRALEGCKNYFKNQRTLKEQQWIDEQHTCEKCGKIMTEKFATGRFCSRSCANGRPKSEEERARIGKSSSVALKQYYAEHPRQPQYKNREEELLALKEEYYKNPNVCSVCGKVLEYEFRKNQTCKAKSCIDELIRRKQLEKVANGTHKGWMRRNKMSYPEQFWQKVLDNNGITYKHDFPISTGKTHYLLDFFINDCIDLEVDGGQHELPEAIEHDRKRDEHVTSRGWHVYRIKWINPYWDEQAVLKQIEDFLTWYRGIIEHEV